MYKYPRNKIIALRIITVVVIFFAIISMLISGFHVVYIRTCVNGSSMSPTLNATYSQDGKRDIVYINRFSKVEVGDIVVLDLRENDSFGDYAVKRLIATEGDTVNMEFRDMQYNLIVNNQIISSRQYAGSPNNTYSSFTQYVYNHINDSSRVIKGEDNQPQGIIIKAGEIFVLGDNWDVSKDSSLVGPFNEKTIVGKVDIIVKPTQNEFLTILKRIF